jgi:hypothetical protein
MYKDVVGMGERGVRGGGNWLRRNRGGREGGLMEKEGNKTRGGKRGFINKCGGVW